MHQISYGAKRIYGWLLLNTLTCFQFSEEGNFCVYQLQINLSNMKMYVPTKSLLFSVEGRQQPQVILSSGK